MPQSCFSWFVRLPSFPLAILASLLPAVSLLSLRGTSRLRRTSGEPQDKHSRRPLPVIPARLKRESILEVRSATRLWRCRTDLI